MKVSELIALLTKFNPEFEVVFPDGLLLTEVVAVDGYVVLSDNDEDNEE